MRPTRIHPMLGLILLNLLQSATGIPIFSHDVATFEAATSLSLPSVPEPFDLRKRATPLPANLPASLAAATYEGYDCLVLPRLMNALALDVPHLLVKALSAADASNLALLRYFHPSDIDDVKKVLISIGVALTSESYMRFVNFNYGKWAWDTHNPCTGRVGGYAVTQSNAPPGVVTSPEQIFVATCPYAFTYQDLGAITCATAGTTTSRTMKSVAFVVLHEMLHWDWLMEQVLGHTIIDWNHLNPVADAWPAVGYGPYNAMQIVQFAGTDSSQEETFPPAGFQTSNVDNFAWFATEAYFRDLCPGVDFAPAPEPQNEPAPPPT